MARPSKEERQARRARESLHKALSQGRDDQAMARFLELPKESRAAHLDLIAPIVHRGIAHAFAIHDWPRLHDFGIKVTAEPALLERGLAADTADELRWALLWGAIQQADFGRAGAFLDGLRTTLAGRPLWRALCALVDQRGSPDPAALDGLAPQAEVKDPRLGYDRVAPRRSPVTAPPSPEHAAGAVYASFATQPWSGFRETVLHWLGKAQRQAVPAIAQTSAALAIGPITDPATPAARRLEAAALIARAIPLAEDRAPLEDAALAALRAVAQALPEGPLEDPKLARTLKAVGCTAALYPRLCPLVDTLVGRTSFGEEVRGLALEMLEEPCAARPSAALLIRALELALPEGEAASPPPWLDALTDRVLDEQPEELARTLAAAAPSRRTEDLERLVDAVSVAQATRALDCLWSLGNDDIRPALAEAFGDLLDRVHEASASTVGRFSLERFRELLADVIGSEAYELPPQALRSLLQTPFGEKIKRHLQVGSPSSGLEGDALALFLRFQERVLLHDPRFMELALQHTPSPMGRRHLLTRALDAFGIDQRLAWLKIADNEDYEKVLGGLRKRLVEGLEHDLEGLARSLRSALNQDAPTWVLRRLAEPLVEGARGRTEELSLDTLRVLAVAKTLAKPRRKKKAATKRRPRTRSSQTRGGATELEPRTAERKR